MNVHVMNQQPSAASGKALNGQTPLEHATLGAGHAIGATANGGVCLTEIPSMGLLVLRLRLDDAAARQTADTTLQSVLGMGLPDTLQATVDNERCIRWMSPDEWLISCPIGSVFDVETRLREVLTLPCAITNVSGGYASLELHGAMANAVLRKSTGYDVHPVSLPPGKVVNTTFAKTGVTLRCVAADHYELLVRRSFADYVWVWLQTASAEYGMHTARRPE